jgi:hypothetical protein
VSFFGWAMVFLGLFILAGAVAALLVIRLWRTVKALLRDVADLAARLTGSAAGDRA